MYKPIRLRYFFVLFNMVFINTFSLSFRISGLFDTKAVKCSEGSGNFRRFVFISQKKIYNVLLSAIISHTLRRWLGTSM